MLSNVKNPSAFHLFPKPWNRNVTVSVQNVTAGNFQSKTCSSIYMLSCYNGLSALLCTFAKSIIPLRRPVLQQWEGVEWMFCSLDKFVFCLLLVLTEKARYSVGSHNYVALKHTPSLSCHQPVVTWVLLWKCFSHLSFPFLFELKYVMGFRNTDFN